MHVDDFLEKINNLNVWKRGGERAPHKPLLLMFALGQVCQGKPRLIPYRIVRQHLTRLLIDFGPPRKSYRPNYPFIYLVNDGIWQLDHQIDTKRDVSDSILLESEMRGGFSEDIYILLLTHRDLLKTAAKIILDNHFPESLHEDIMRAVGMDTFIFSKKPRDPKFRELVLIAYEFSCAVCGFNVRLGDTLVGLEAAHIKWHQAGGPDQINNGLALCSMHHKLFDRGVFTVSSALKIQVAQIAHGNAGFKEWLIRYHGKEITHPQSLDYYPAAPFVDWHAKEVFRGPARTN